MQGPLLVTGSHRSGTTWVGKSLALGDELGYIDEPFHPRHRPGICGAKVTWWYEHVAAGSPNEPMWRAAFQRMLAFDYGYGRELSVARSPRDVGRMVRDSRRLSAFRRRGLRPLVKDPLAFFSSEWIASTFGAQVLVLTRHPAAFVSSLKRLSWEFDVRNWLDQEGLMRTLLADHEAELREFAREPRDIVDQGVLCWKVIAAVTEDYARRHPEWVFVRHEDLSLDPEAEYGKLFARFGLDFTPEVRAALLASTRAENPSEAPTGVVHALSRDSAENVRNWTKRLSPEEVRRIRDGVGEVGARFYGDAEW